MILATGDAKLTTAGKIPRKFSALTYSQSKQVDLLSRILFVRNIFNKVSLNSGQTQVSLSQKQDRDSFTFGCQILRSNHDIMIVLCHILLSTG